MAVGHRSECLTRVCFRLFLVGKLTSNGISCKEEHYRSLLCQFGRDLKVILRVGGLGVEDRQKIPDITYLRHLFLRDWPNEEVCLSKPMD